MQFLMWLHTFDWNLNLEKVEVDHEFFSRVSKLPSAENTNIHVGVEATKSVNAEVLRVLEDTETEAAQCQGCKRKVYTAFTPEQRASISTVIVMYQHV